MYVIRQEMSFDGIYRSVTVKSDNSEDIIGLMNVAMKSAGIDCNGSEPEPDDCDEEDSTPKPARNPYYLSEEDRDALAEMAKEYRRKKS